MRISETNDFTKIMNHEFTKPGEVTLIEIKEDNIGKYEEKFSRLLGNLDKEFAVGIGLSQAGVLLKQNCDEIALPDVKLNSEEDMFDILSASFYGLNSIILNLNLLSDWPKNLVEMFLDLLFERVKNQEEVSLLIVSERIKNKDKDSFYPYKLKGNMQDYGVKEASNNIISITENYYSKISHAEAIVTKSTNLDLALKSLILKR